MAKARENQLIRTVGLDLVPGQAYDQVFIIGPDFEELYVNILEEEAARSGLRCCFIGNGRDALTKDCISTAIKDKVDDQTVVHVNGHGSARLIRETQESKSWSEHYISIYSEPYYRDRKTSILLGHLKDLGCNDVELWSCFGGAAACDVPDGLRLTMHSSKDKRSLVAMNIEGMVNLLRHHSSLNDAYQRFAYSMVTSPETIVYSEKQGGEARVFTARTPDNRVNSNLTIARYLSEQSLADFYQFRSSEDGLGHDCEIAGMSIDDQMAARYRQLQLVMDSSCGDIERYGNIESIVDGCLIDGMTPLLMACSYKKFDVASYLLDRGADIEKPDKWGFTPLLRACENGHLTMVNMLLEYNANPNQANKDGDTPLAIACEKECEAVVAKLLKHRDIEVDKVDGDGHTPLSVACFKGNLAIVNMLLKSDAQVNKARDDGAIALHTACYYGKLDIAARLLEAGSDLTALWEGKTPIQVAEEQGHTQVAEMLRQGQIQASENKVSVSTEQGVPSQEAPPSTLINAFHSHKDTQAGIGHH